MSEIVLSESARRRIEEELEAGRARQRYLAGLPPEEALDEAPDETTEGGKTKRRRRTRAEIEAEKEAKEAEEAKAQLSLFVQDYDPNKPLDLDVEGLIAKIKGE